MAKVTVRNIDDRIVASLKAQAKANNRSLEGEIRHVLGQQALRSARVEEFRERTAQLPYFTEDLSQADSVPLIRDGCDR